MFLVVDYTFVFVICANILTPVFVVALSTILWVHFSREKAIRHGKLMSSLVYHGYIHQGWCHWSVIKEEIV